MKKILITGANSYIGTSFETYLKTNFPDAYTVDTVDMIDGTWKEKSFAGYDVVYHVAGIAHQKETKENASLYYKVNRDLAIETAKKAKADGVKHFVFLSSMSVYGVNIGVITKNTVPTPRSNYGASKLQAEEQLASIADETFRVALVRPPMVYGKGCKGNFQSVIKLVKKLPVFPHVKNQRSMIYIDNLSSFVKMVIDQNLFGVYLPQNREYLQTSMMAQTVAESLGKKIYMSAILGFLVKLSIPFLGLTQKGFGSLIYSQTEDFDFSYCVVDNRDSILKSV